MKITILCVGSLKEDYLRKMAAEYIKRLGSYAEIIIKEVKEEMASNDLSKAEEEEVKNKEGARLLSLLKPTDFAVALDLGKEEPDSPGLASLIEKWMVASSSRLYFLIGGSLGLSEEVKKRANVSISLSRLTFTHQMSRVILLEQLYRSFRILRHEPYHK